MPEDIKPADIKSSKLDEMIKITNEGSTLKYNIDIETELNKLYKSELNISDFYSALRCKFDYSRLSD